MPMMRQPERLPYGVAHRSAAFGATSPLVRAFGEGPGSESDVAEVEDLCTKIRALEADRLSWCRILVQRTLDLWLCIGIDGRSHGAANVFREVASGANTERA